MPDVDETRLGEIEEGLALTREIGSPVAAITVELATDLIAALRESWAERDKLRETASVLSIQQTICEVGAFRSDAEAREAYRLLYAAWADLRLLLNRLADLERH